MAHEEGHVDEQQLETVASNIKQGAKDLVEPITDAASVAAQKMKDGITAANDAVAQALILDYGTKGNNLYFPLSLGNDEDKAQECMCIRIFSRDHTEKKQIWLLTPPGLSIPDGASYNAVDLGTLVGKAVEEGSKAKAAIAKAFGGDFAGARMKAGEIGGIADLVAASTLTAVKNSGSPLGDHGLMTAGLVANPYTSNAFEGTNIRSFEFTFKLIAESKEESDAARNIENTFRKFLYPRTHPDSDLVLVYPPYWEIKFYRTKDNGTGLEPNKFMPQIQLCNLVSMNTTFNASGNSYHPKGAPIEVDLSLSFTEASALVRDDLYKEGGGFGQGAINYDNIEYTGDTGTGIVKALT